MVAFLSLRFPGLKSLVVGSVLIEMLITHAWEGACLPFALQVISVHTFCQFDIKNSGKYFSNTLSCLQYLPPLQVN